MCSIPFTVRFVSLSLTLTMVMLKHLLVVLISSSSEIEESETSRVVMVGLMKSKALSEYPNALSSYSTELSLYPRAVQQHAMRRQCRLSNIWIIAANIVASVKSSRVRSRKRGHHTPSLKNSAYIAKSPSLHQSATYLHDSCALHTI